MKTPPSPLPWATYAGAQSSSQELIVDVQLKSPVLQFVPVVSGSVPGHHWEEPSSALSAASLQVCKYIGEIPQNLLFSG